MNCDGIREKLSALIDGELPDEIAAVVERHLESCAECARIRTELAGVAAAFRSLPKATAPAGFAEGVARAIGQLPAAKTTTFPRRRTIEWVIAAAAAVLIAVNVIYVIDYRRAEDARPATQMAEERREIATERPSDSTFRKESTKGKEGRDLRISKGGEGHVDKVKEDGSFRVEKRMEEPEIAKKDAPAPVMRKGVDRENEPALNAPPETARQEAPAQTIAPQPSAPTPPIVAERAPVPANPAETGKSLGTEIEVVTIAAKDVKATLAKIDAFMTTNALAASDVRGREGFKYGDSDSGKKAGERDEKLLPADARYLTCNESQRTLLMAELTKVGVVVNEAASGAKDLKILADEAAKSEEAFKQRDRPQESLDDLKEQLKSFEKAAPSQGEEKKPQAVPGDQAMPQAVSPPGDKPGMAAGAAPALHRLLIRVVEEPENK